MNFFYLYIVLTRSYFSQLHLLITYTTLTNDNTIIIILIILPVGYEK